MNTSCDNTLTFLSKTPKKMFSTSDDAGFRSFTRKLCGAFLSSGKESDSRELSSGYI